MEILRKIYKVIRSILFSAILICAGFYLILYLLLSLPAVQDKIKYIAETELSKQTGGIFQIGSVAIFPFNEVVLSDVIILDPENQECISSEKIGAGIDLASLIKEQKIVITYAELLAPHVTLIKSAPDRPLNIQFLIDAFSSKEKNKPPTKFDIRINSVILRKGELTFSKLWIPGNFSEHKFNPNRIRVEDISADIHLPELKNDSFKIDLRRIAFKSGDLTVEKVGGKVWITPRFIDIKDFIIRLQATYLHPSDIRFHFDGFNDIIRSLKEGRWNLEITNGVITPSDFKFFQPLLGSLNLPVSIDTEITGNLKHLSIEELRISTPDKLFLLDVKGQFNSLADIKNFSGNLESLRLVIPKERVGTLCDLIPGMPQNVAELCKNVGGVNIGLKGKINLMDGFCQLTGFLKTTDCGELALDAISRGKFDSKQFKINGIFSGTQLNLGRILQKDILGKISFDVDADVNFDGLNSVGNLHASIPLFEINGRSLSDINISFEKSVKNLYAYFDATDGDSQVLVDADMLIDGINSALKLNANINNLALDRYIPNNPLQSTVLSTNLKADLYGNNLSNLLGDIFVYDFVTKGNPKINLNCKSLHLFGHRLTNSSDEIKQFSRDFIPDEHERVQYGIESPWIDGEIHGQFNWNELISLTKRILAETYPSLLNDDKSNILSDDIFAEYYFQIKKDDTLCNVFNLPVEWMTDFNISGQINSENDKLTLYTTLPYIVQSKKNLIRNSHLDIEIFGKDSKSNIDISTIYPTKKGDLKLDLSVFSLKEHFDILIGFNKGLDTSFRGDLHLDAILHGSLISGHPEIYVRILPTSLFLNNAEWRVACPEINYKNSVVNVNDFFVRHEAQFVGINGIAGRDPDSKLKVELADIDLEYIFDTLNINYVQFGGMATGSVFASDLLTGNMHAEVDKLDVKSLSYNGTILGDGDISAKWNNSEKCVEMAADIRENGKNVALMNGGIWVTRDSLSFDFDAHKVNIGFLHPFMATFAEKVEGRASGRALLYGTFKDIDMKGRLLADTISIKLGFTNVTYSGSDSVIINPGKIEIPSFRLYDKEKNSAVLHGILTHRFFHDPAFDFRLTDIKSLLCYDTNQILNPDWYGTIYGSGAASVVGRPGFVDITANVTTERRSNFSFVLSDRKDAGDYAFLSFTDKRKETINKNKIKVDDTPDFVREFRKKQEEKSGAPTIFSMQIRADVTPDATLNIIMDPAAGDKIKANGNGNINIGYSSDSDEMTMFGRYTLEEGVYNFSLQDLILKDFIIKKGSTISFNGNPLDASVNITAAYRVNTNLTDLDKSFANDKELNRTNVPVDALLMVSGELQNPSVDFDIDLPTMTDETTRKVKSIISTQDMMSRQIIYLLALNRFYTPEYMGSSSSGGEWASVASSTISSQLSSMLGQLTDKVNVMPSLRSDKGDFSDVEVDVALSSRLLNNRLLLNGNFGYRDRATSNTTFVGDFDIEYLLNPKGNLRLKAYNHFNDQNYYLKSALTTQGIGIIYRKEFDNPFTFLKKQKKSHDLDSVKVIKKD